MFKSCKVIHRASIALAGSYFFYCSAVSVAVAALFIGCSVTLAPEATPSSEVPQNLSASPPVKTDALTRGINQAGNAAQRAQSAKSAADWDAVAKAWMQAILSLQSVPPNSPERVYAQKKVAEYMEFLTIAQQRAAIASFGLKYPTFNNQLLDNQLVLYLSYVAAVGPPDVLVVGSSRSLQGVDPRQMQQALAFNGFPGLKIYNFGINGATAQVIDLLMRRILTPEQLPRLIIWADGVRAFNSGRVDRTYNLIVSSPGYKRLLSGDRPRSSFEPLTPPIAMEAMDSLQLSPNLVSRTQLSDQPQDKIFMSSFTFSKLQLSKEPQLSQAAPTGLTPNYSLAAFDANGFVPVNIRFNPRVYYQQKPRVSGRYDADYASFRLGGQQEVALNNFMIFANQRRIPVVFANLPLSSDYLDPVRQKYEQLFRQYMQRQARAKGLIFVDLYGQLRENSYFADPSHLNLYGAAAVARRIAAESRIPWPR